MIRYGIGLIVCLLALLPALGQTPNYSQDIAPILYTHCTSCHRPGEIGPMPFTNYSEAVAYGAMIKSVTQSRYMPPWKPDPAYRSFVDENVLSTAQIQAIKDWVDGGMPQGNPALEPPLPSFPTGSQIGVPDLVLPMTQAFTQTGNNTDQYRIFVLPTGLQQDKEIKAIEFRPGNKRITHHAIIGMDTTNQANVLDQAQAGYGYTQYGGFGFTPNEPLLAGWTPGMSPKVYPQGIGKVLWKNSKLLLQMHYAPTPIPETDSSVINIFYANAPLTRQATLTPITPQHLLNGPFVIQPNTVKTFRARYTIGIAVSLLNLLPHGHLLCKSWEAYAVKPNGDTIKLVKINDWDFNWQGMYSFRNMQPLPAGTQLFVHGTYDNTASNPLNPHSPPQIVRWGENTADEMFLLYLTWVPYQVGDENIVISVNEPIPGVIMPGNKIYPVYPNPSGDHRTLGFSLEKAGKIKIALFDLNGKEVQVIKNQEWYSPGIQTVGFSVNSLAKGMYLLRIVGDGFDMSEKMLVH